MSTRELKARFSRSTWSSKSSCFISTYFSSALSRLILSVASVSARRSVACSGVSGRSNGASDEAAASGAGRVPAASAAASFSSSSTPSAYFLRSSWMKGAISLSWMRPVCSLISSSTLRDRITVSLPSRLAAIPLRAMLFAIMIALRCVSLQVVVSKVKIASAVCCSSRSVAWSVSFIIPRNLSTIVGRFASSGFLSTRSANVASSVGPGRSPDAWERGSAMSNGLRWYGSVCSQRPQVAVSHGGGRKSCVPPWAMSK